MNTLSDRDYLKHQQYHDSGNLDARIQLHQRFSTNPAVYFEWMYDHLHIQPGMSILEVGCGSGELWRTNRKRLPEPLKITLLDLSQGMTVNARSNLQNDHRFVYGAADVQHLPFADGQFQCGIANYMLYHVPDISLAVHELRRVLAPGAVLCAATNSLEHMQELYALMNRFGLKVSPKYDFTARYGLENAAGILGEYFDRVDVVPYIDSLFVTDPAALMAYIRSMNGIWDFEPEAEVEMGKWLVAEIKAKGGFRIRKASGLVLAG